MSTETAKRQVEKTVTISTTCDGCGHKIDGEAEDGWYEFEQHHGEWGNDSSESFEWFDACSWACYVKVIRRLLDDYGENRPPASLRIDDKDPVFLAGLMRAGLWA